MLVTIENREYDLNNYDDFQDICRKYGNTDSMLFGKTENDELMTISINFDNVITEVYQDNDWIRKNIYTKDSVEEIYEKE